MSDCGTAWRQRDRFTAGVVARRVTEVGTIKAYALPPLRTTVSSPLEDDRHHCILGDALSSAEQLVDVTGERPAVAVLHLGGLQRERLDRVAVGCDATVVLDSVNGLAGLDVAESQGSTSRGEGLVVVHARGDVRRHDGDARADVALGTGLVRHDERDGVDTGSLLRVRR